MKKTTIVVLIGCALALTFGTMALSMGTNPSVLENVTNAEAMWNDEKLLVIVQKRVAVLRTNWLLRRLSQLIGVVFPQPRFIPDDLIIFRIEGGKIERQEHLRVGKVGGIIPFEGHIYFLRGSEPEDYPYLHRLVGKELVRVPREEAMLIVNSFELESELVKREGWQKLEFYFTEGRKQYAIEQGGTKNDNSFFKVAENRNFKN